MKKVILIVGALVITFNTLIGLIVSSYATFNIIATNISLLISIAIIFYLAYSNMSNGFKIGLSIFFFITGLVRFFIMLFANPVFENNYLIIIVFGFIIFEVICTVFASFADKGK